jgi:hypothetical protein
MLNGDVYIFAFISLAHLATGILRMPSLVFSSFILTYLTLTVISEMAIPLKGVLSIVPKYCWFSSGSETLV